MHAAMTEQLIEVTTLGDLLLRAANGWPEHDALIFPGRKLSYAQLAARAREQARGLIAIGVTPGEHIGILAPNMPEVIELMFAIALVGAVAVPLNARYKTSELAHVIDNADLRLLFTTCHTADYVDFPQLLCTALPGLATATDPRQLQLDAAPLLRSVVTFESSELPGFMTNSVIAAEIDDTQFEERRARVALRSVCLMMYTSGTTSHPKGCCLSHEALVRSAHEMNRRLEITPQDCMWDPLPMFHLGAILPLLAMVWCGGTYVTDTHFNVDTALEQLEREQPSILYPAFPAIMADLVNHPKFDVGKIPRVRLINNVAPSERLRANIRLIPQAVHISAYGMTEASGISCHGCAAEDDETRATTCGRPYAGVQMRVIDPQNDCEALPGTPGEMQIRGFSLFEGYYKSPEHNAKAFTADGWFRTGDRCAIDSAGRIRYHGRLKDMLKIGGENVAALEIESFLGTHPAVQLVQVVGAPDERLQEVAAAFIQLKAGTVLTEADIIDFCRGRIASFKIPRHVRFVSEWPMSATKIQKYALKQQLEKELAARQRPTA